VIVAGVMSGTSADGINIALVEINRKPETHRFDPSCLTLELLGHTEYRFPAPVRETILGFMNAERAKVADLARLNFFLGELYADAVLKAQKKFKLKAQLIGCHGQTLYHQGNAQRFLGRSVAVTWQTGEGAVLAARTAIPVVSDFRPADMAAGGKGAPLVPFLDYTLYSSDKIGRIVQNIGGIANLTAIPARGSPNDVIAFDTGPGNMLIDGVTQHLYKRPFDRHGRIAASGKILEPVVADFLRAPFFSRKPPKTAGREEFGREFAADWLRRCRGRDKSDVVATATAFTARSIAAAIRRFVLNKSPDFAEMIVAGGGTKNATLMRMLQGELSGFGLRLRTSDELGVPSESKEAVAFALLAFQSWHHQPSNIPAATGATRPAILGKVSYV
jgi:anhydro-N-acetylmuramic acid kinase